MRESMNAVVAWLRRRAENVVAGLLAIMFVAFILQILFRYVFDLPVGWTAELSVIAWLYMVLLGSAFWLKDGEEIRFDLLEASVGRRLRRIIGVLVAGATVVLFAMSLPATIDYVAFMKVERSSYLKIRLDWLYSVYAVFAVAVIVRHAWRAWRLLRGDDVRDDTDVTEKGYGL